MRSGVCDHISDYLNSLNSIQYIADAGWNVVGCSSPVETELEIVTSFDVASSVKRLQILRMFDRWDLVDLMRELTCAAINNS